MSVTKTTTCLDSTMSYWTTNGGFTELIHIITISAALGQLLYNRCRRNGHQQISDVRIS